MGKELGVGGCFGVGKELGVGGRFGGGKELGVGGRFGGGKKKKGFVYVGGRAGGSPRPEKGPNDNSFKSERYVFWPTEVLGFL